VKADYKGITDHMPHMLYICNTGSARIAARSSDEDFVIKEMVQ
jgi:hypothetical protein